MAENPTQTELGSLISRRRGESSYHRQGCGKARKALFNSLNSTGLPVQRFEVVTPTWRYFHAGDQRQRVQNDFLTQLRKEIMEQFRTRRFLIVLIVLLVFGMLSP